MENSKKNYIKSLEKMEIILGNGFDLFCGLKTRYSDFFESNNASLQTKDWAIHLDFGRLKTYFNKEIENREQSAPPKTPKDSSLWHLFFYLKSPQKENSKWCEIEEEMLHSFERKENVNNNMSFWDMVFKLLSCETKAIPKYGTATNEDIESCGAYMLKKYGFESEEKIFFKHLLKELNMFEKDFGSYVLNQIKQNKDYYLNSEKLLKRLSTNTSKIVSIDSFNYSNLGKNKDRISFHNVNGDAQYPIFGIDSANIKINNPAYIFTKTSRRLIRDINSFFIAKLGDFKNVVVYGHSLNEQDYSFFFPIFDYLKLDDASQSTSIIFAYSEFEGCDSDEICMEQMEAICSIFYRYEKYLHPEREEMRLLDSLSAQGRIISRKI